VAEFERPWPLSDHLGVKLAPESMLWEIPTVKTLKVDARKRVRLPDVRPQQVLSYQNNGDGSFTLREMKEPTAEPFPKGSLLKYITRRRNKEQLALLKGSTLDRP
jgi:hypothetical protein